MKLYIEEALVLKSVSMRDADRVLTLYSRARGKIRAVAHGADKPSSRKRGSVQPFTYGKFQLRRGRELDSVEQCEGLEYFKRIRESLEGIAFASYMSELVDVFTSEGEATPGIFELIMETYGGIGGGRDSIIVRSFELKLLSLSGYRPHLENCVSCGGEAGDGRAVLVPALGGLACSRCAAGHAPAYSLKRDAVEVMKLIMKWSPDRLARIKIGGGTEKEMKNALRGFIQYHLESRLKSVRFLDWLENE